MNNVKDRYYNFIVDKKNIFMMVIMYEFLWGMNRMLYQTVTISIDGDKESHDRFRLYQNGQGSYNQVLNAIKLLLPSTKVIARITINEYNPNIHEHVKHLVSIGVKYITYAYDYKLTDSTFRIFQNSVRLLFNNYYEDICSKKYYNLT